MKRTNLNLMLGIFLAFAMMSCQNEDKPQVVEEPAVEVAPQEEPVKEVVSTIDFNNMVADTIANFKGGEGELYMKMFVDGETRVMLCTVPAGSSVGYHTHDTNMEVILVQQGTATIALDGVEQDYTVGQAHYCPKGHGHSISNMTDSDLIIYNVISLQ